MSHSFVTTDPITSDQMPVRQVFRFDDFEFCDIPLRLTKNGREIKVRKQSLRILSTLLGSVGRPVSTQQLMDAVRPNGGGDEGAIRVAVAHLRTALNGSDECIETLRGLGYRFAHPVEVEQEPLLRTRAPQPAPTGS